MDSKVLLTKIYGFLLDKYGPQGWWPLLEYEGSNPTKTGSLKNYHPGDYSYPKNDRQRLEICVGAILVQSTAWSNVEKALLNIREMVEFDHESLLGTEEEKLKQAIRPAGYYNQKAKTLLAFSEFYASLEGKTPSREELLGIRGIGKETADSILLYAFGQSTFIVDAYARRIFGNLGLIDANVPYDKIKRFFEENLEPDVALFQEYHALLVEHGKRFYSGDGNECPLKALL